MRLHRTNIEKFWVTNSIPDNAVVSQDKLIVVDGALGSVCFTDFKKRKASIQEELTSDYGTWELGEPQPTARKSAAAIAALGIVGIYSRSRPGEGLSGEAVNRIIETALSEHPPDDVSSRAAELMRAG
jgi:hypothetical protein